LRPDFIICSAWPYCCAARGGIGSAAAPDAAPGGVEPGGADWLAALGVLTALDVLAALGALAAATGATPTGAAAREGWTGAL
jgi:hypothetical protein